MRNSVKALLKELETFGRQHDAVSDKDGRMLNITHETGEFLAVLTRATGARRILEIGTSNGYSALWLADALGTSGGRVTTVELSGHKAALARANFARACVQERIEQIEGEAGGYLAGCPDASVDLLFLDAERRAYLDWLPELARVLRVGGLLVVDNAVSHAQELAPFMQAVRADCGWTSSLVQVGKGEFLAIKH